MTGTRDLRLRSIERVNIDRGDGSGRGPSAVFLAMQNDRRHIVAPDPPTALQGVIRGSPPAP
jgi:hypothetical protein